MNETKAGRPQKAIEPKKCEKCGVDFYRHKFKGRFEDERDYLNRKYCSSYCEIHNNAMVHELVRVKVNDYYVSLSNRLTTNRDEAKLLHPTNGKVLATATALKYKSDKITIEMNGVQY